MTSLADAVRSWHDFYVLLGTAAATLVGLLFVAASVGSSIFTEDKQHALRAFLSPSVVHFSSVLVACLIAIAPVSGWVLLGLLVGADGLFGFVYCGLVWRSMVRHGLSRTIDMQDRLGYAALPAVGYVLVIAAGIALAWQHGIGCGVLALGRGAVAAGRHPQRLGHDDIYNHAAAGLTIVVISYHKP